MKPRSVWSRVDYGLIPEVVPYPRNEIMRVALISKHRVPMTCRIDPHAAGEGFALREEWPQLWGKSRGLCRWLCSGGQAQKRPTTVSRISNLYPGLRASSLRKPTQVRSRLGSRVHGPRRSGCRSGRARRLLRSHTPSARATADRDEPRRPRRPSKSGRLL